MLRLIFSFGTRATSTHTTTCCCRLRCEVSVQFVLIVNAVPQKLNEDFAVRLNQVLRLHIQKLEEQTAKLKQPCFFTKTFFHGMNCFYYPFFRQFEYIQQDLLRVIF